MARPIKEVSVEQIELLAGMNCSVEEIASVVGIHQRTIQRRYAAVLEKGRAGGRASLKKKMFDMAMSGNTTMCIWLSKQMLGYTDKVIQKVEEKVESNIVYKTEWGGTAEPSDAVSD